MFFDQAEFAVRCEWGERGAGDLRAMLLQCGSGKELVGRGVGEDVELAAAVDSSNTVPLLTDGAYQNYRRGG